MEFGKNASNNAHITGLPFSDEMCSGDIPGGRIGVTMESMPRSYIHRHTFAVHRIYDQVTFFPFQ